MSSTETSGSPETSQPSGSSAPPTADQLTQARLARWHQNATPLATIETIREWLTRAGLVLYAPRPSQAAAPAPTLVEATLGAANAEPSLAETSNARQLLTRLIADGQAVPLNLMGVTGALGTDVPDYIASPAVFSYIFTLRGNKAWKQPPATTGAVKVSPLALAAYELLAEKHALTAQELAAGLGKEVTEAAVMRALTELWSQLRVLPLAQAEGAATVWELTSARFTKQIKAGANAGQPTALSALVSLYLGQAIAASEDEVETFLSPLAPRSRVREVLHALLGARQLETLVIGGKTLLHVTGDLPGFAVAATPEGTAEEGAAETGPELAEDGSRIRKFAAKPGGKIGTGLRAKPAFGARAGARPAFGSKPAFGRKPAFGGASAGKSFGSRAGAPPDRERRPFRRDDAAGARPGRPARPAFDRPWEERAARPAADGENLQAAEGIDSAAAGSRSAPRKSFSKPGTFGRKREGFGGGASAPRAGGRSGFGSGEARPPRRDFAASSDRPARSDRPDRPARPFRAPDSDRGAGPERPFNADRGARPARPFSSDRPSGSPRGDRPARSFSASGESRPERRERPDRPSFAPSSGPRSGASGARPDRAPRGEGFKPRAGGGERGSRPSFGGKPSGGKPSFDRRPSSGARPAFGGKSFAPRDAAGPVSRGEDAPRRTFRKFDAPRGPRAEGSAPRAEGSKPFGAKPYAAKRAFGTRPAGGDRPARTGEGAGAAGGAKKPWSKPAGGPRSSGSAFGAKGGPFAKFADGKKPFRKPGEPRGPRPASGGGGFKPVRRKRDEGA